MVLVDTVSDLPTLRGEESEAESPSNKDPADGVKGLVFLFSHGAKTTAGIIGGTAANVDFHLPTAAGVSDYHFAITFNSRNQPIVKDLGSLGGTKVTYTGERGQRLSNFEWPLLGPSIANGMPPLLHASSHLIFKVIVTTWTESHVETKIHAMTKTCLQSCKSEYRSWERQQCVPEGIERFKVGLQHRRHFCLDMVTASPPTHPIPPSSAPLPQSVYTSAYPPSASTPYPSSPSRPPRTPSRASQ